MLLRLMLLPILVLPLAAQAQTTGVDEFPWTRLPAAEFERFEAKLGDVRVNNLALERAARRTPAGAATAYDFSVAVSNRSKGDVHVLVQVVGIKGDATPTLSVDANADVESRHNDILRSTGSFGEQALADTVAYYVRIVAGAAD